MNIELSRSAERDLRELRAQIGEDSADAAEAVTGRIMKALLLLRNNPDIGRPRPPGTVREWSVPGLPYVIPYKVVSGTLFILRIWHTRRERPDAW